MKAKGFLLFCLGLACVACCAAPFIAGGAAAAGAAGLGAGWPGWVLAGGAIVVGAFALRSRQALAACSATTTGCGCSGSRAAPESPEKPAIACTLTGDYFVQRTAWIRSLAKDHLIDVQRTPLSLRLTYAKQAAGKITELVAKERACCAFLDFKTREIANGVELTVTAPAEAAETAHFLFDHFAPELASNQKELA